jgi:hypothetical protein
MCYQDRKDRCLEDSIFKTRWADKEIVKFNYNQQRFHGKTAPKAFGMKQGLAIDNFELTGTLNFIV